MNAQKGRYLRYLQGFYSRLTLAACYRPPSDDYSLERMSQCLASLPGTTPLLVMDGEVWWRARPGDGALPDLATNSGRATRALFAVPVSRVSRHRV